MRVLLVGAGAREHAIGQGLVTAGAELYAVAPQANPGIQRLAREVHRASATEPGPIVAFAQARSVDYAVIGPEAPLAAGVPDALRAAGIPVVGPSRSAARIESSKEFARSLLASHHVDGLPRHATVGSDDEVDRAVAEFDGPFVVKPVGLSSGKGVWVQGRDFQTAPEGASYAKRLLTLGGDRVVLEERLDGEEFSLMAFVCDSGIYPMPLVQDYKRARENDEGPNTGGMGAYSQRDHLLPFLSMAHRDRALDIVRQSVAAMHAEGLEYRGVLYGGFMLTARGPFLVEFNARFGDPEGLNALTLYEEGNLAELLSGVAHGSVDPALLRFRLRATVVKYLVPPGYGTAPRAGGTIELDEPRIEQAGVRLFFGDVEAAGPGRFTMGTSRSIALVGEASAIHEASARVDAALRFAKGDFYVRRDIGTRTDLVRRTEHMRTLFVPGAKPSPLPLSVAAPDAPPSSLGTSAQVIGE
ncbi:MAG TPA: phosphoribosylamine--glycine ligase [Thermoplasmata archaeon]|nr:phosphoribosylamine--glycine ligase [Thermoplasmata archaeon]HEV2519934.1 phosphoribosylamine--glycine ligase [Thermoplasmata archaeon]